MPISRQSCAALAVVAALCGFASGAAAQGAPDYATIVGASDRSDADRVIDKRRDPVKLLAFIGVRSGMRVLDMGAGGGYSTELLARTVAPKGVVYAQNAPTFGGRGKERWDARANNAAMKSVVLVLRPFDDPAPPELRDLDLITFLFYYHDVSYMQVDRAAMNRKLFALLKPGAMLIVADHSARPGDGISVGKSLHRIEEALVRREVEAAGFKLATSADFLRQPTDKRDFNVNKRTGPVDEFVLKFQKP
ncbi:MAG: class I SAM-dependent methyltransferase [Xanthobacteraceae bacterium]